MTRTILLGAVLSLLACVSAHAQEAAVEGLQFFTVLRSGKLIAPSEAATNADAHCAIVGAGGSAAMQCNPAPVTLKTSYHYNTALIVDANGTGYIVACREALVTNLWCSKADPGTVVQGRLSNGHLSIADGEKLHDYQLLTAAVVGAIPVVAAAPAPTKAPKNQAKAAPFAPAQPVAASAPPASSKPVAAQPVPSTESTAACASPSSACVSFVSEPQGADIYIDGKFSGNTPSVLALAPGSHEIRVESMERKPWTRTLETTAGSKITIRATLENISPQN